MLSPHYRVIRLDLPGYGLTGPSAGKDYSMRWYADFLEAFLKKINIGSCYLAGNSLGGHIAVNFTAEHRNSVNKLILIDSGGYPLDERGLLVARMAHSALLRPILRYATPRFFVAMNLKQVYGDKGVISDDVLDRYYELLLREGNREVFIDILNKKPEDSSALIKSIHIPTLILWGGKDKTLTLKFAELFHRDVSPSRLIVYDSAGHVPHEELPEKTALDVLSFFGEQTGGKDDK